MVLRRGHRLEQHEGLGVQLLLADGCDSDRGREKEEEAGRGLSLPPSLSSPTSRTRKTRCAAGY